MWFEGSINCLHNLSFSCFFASSVGFALVVAPLYELVFLHQDEEEEAVCSCQNTGSSSTKPPVYLSFGRWWLSICVRSQQAKADCLPLPVVTVSPNNMWTLGVRIHGWKMCHLMMGKFHGNYLIIYLFPPLPPLLGLNPPFSSSIISAYVDSASKPPSKVTSNSWAAFFFFPHYMTHHFY